MTPNKTHAKTSRWVAQQARDPYVKKARRDGYRARAVFKLEQIDRKYHLIKPDSRIIDLGAAPGSWSQYAASRVRSKNQIIAVDLLAMQAVAKVHFIRGDFTWDSVRAQVLAALGNRPADLVLCDMAPNLSGIRSRDQAHAYALQQVVCAFCLQGLRPGGALLIKQFAGEQEAAVRAQLAEYFAQVRALKPDASRAQSKELYLLASGLRETIA